MHLWRRSPPSRICVGLSLAIVAWAMDVPDDPAHDWLNAAAVGIVSGWAATGLNQSVKQLTDK